MDINQCVRFLEQKIVSRPQIGLILGSGLSPPEHDSTHVITVPYTDIPGFYRTTVEGHKGELIFSQFHGKQLAIMNGRFHYYEGHSMQDICAPVRVMKRLGVSTLIVTNAAGGINRDFAPGDLMIIKDHIKFFSDSPLRGKNDPSFGPRFNSMCEAYTKRLIDIAQEAAYALSISLKSGVYAFMPGPSYETPAEINALRILGADAVGMSTVGEVIAANHAGMEVLGISCITNMAAGVLDSPIDHQEVLQTGAAIKEKFSSLLREIIYKI